MPGGLGSLAGRGGAGRSVSGNYWAVEGNPDFLLMHGDYVINGNCGENVRLTVVTYNVFTYSFIFMNLNLGIFLWLTWIMAILRLAAFDLKRRKSIALLCISFTNLVFVSVK